MSANEKLFLNSGIWTGGCILISFACVMTEMTFGMSAYLEFAQWVFMMGALPGMFAFFVSLVIFIVCE